VYGIDVTGTIETTAGINIAVVTLGDVVVDSDGRIVHQPPTRAAKCETETHFPMVHVPASSQPPIKANLA
jgi:hypothetical protein